MSDIRDEMSPDITKLYRDNYIFKANIDRGISFGLSYERTLELACLTFANIQESYNQEELKRIMRRPTKSMILHEDQIFQMDH